MLIKIFLERSCMVQEESD